MHAAFTLFDSVHNISLKSMNKYSISMSWFNDEQISKLFARNVIPTKSLPHFLWIMVHKFKNMFIDVKNVHSYEFYDIRLRVLEQR